MIGAFTSSPRSQEGSIILGGNVNGKIVEEFEVFDQLGMFQAIGTLPALPASV